jgi:hypothetical protein
MGRPMPRNTGREGNKLTSKPDNLPQAAKPGAPLLDQFLVRGNLVAEDIERYQRVVVALSETIPSWERLMKSSTRAAGARQRDMKKRPGRSHGHGHRPPSTDRQAHRPDHRHGAARSARRGTTTGCWPAAAATRRCTTRTSGINRWRTSSSAPDKLETRDAPPSGRVSVSVLRSRSGGNTPA